MKKLVSIVLSLMILATTGTANIFALEGGYEPTIYRNNGFSFEKLSHAESGTETNDGVIDYVNGKTVPHVNGDVNIGDAVQSYSYCAASHDDWIYINTMYGALSAYSTASDGFKSLVGGLGIEVSDDFGTKVVDAVFNGKLNRGKEDDGSYEGSVLFKFNINTGETVILMSRDLYEEDVLANGAAATQGVPIFRYATELDGKIYFVGLVSTFPDGYEEMYKAYHGAGGQIDPYLDGLIKMQTGVPMLYCLEPSGDNTPETLTKVKEFISADDIEEITVASLGQNFDYTKMMHGAFTSTRAIGIYKNALVVGAVELREEGAKWNYDPENPTYSPAGASLYMSLDPSNGDSYFRIADQDDLYNYPAIWRDGASGGGGVYQVVEFNGKLYVSIVTGRRETKDPVKGQFQAYAVVEGTPIDPEDLTAGFTWKPIVGDTADGALYPYGIDSSRRASNAVTMQVYGDYLYLGDYNDVNGSLNSLLAGNLAELRYNLEDSINLYRLDKENNIECVVGDPTEMFPEGGISGWGSGYESNHLMQYTWMTTVFNDVMYLSSMDETSLTHVLAQFVNGELLHMSKTEWESQLQYIGELIKDLMPSEEVVEEPEETEALVEAEALVEDDSDLFGALDELTEKFNKIKDLIDSTDRTSFIGAIKDAKEALDTLGEVPSEIRDLFSGLLNTIDRTQLEHLQRIMEYLECSVAGFDLYTIKQDKAGNVSIQTVTLDGFNDRYNHGLRIFENVNGNLVIGTANPFYGTQIWKMIDTPYVANVEEAKEAIVETVDKSNDLAINAMLNGNNEIAADAGMASANEIAAGLHLEAAKDLTENSDKYTEHKALDANKANEEAKEAANKASEALEEARKTDDAKEATELATDAYLAKEEAEAKAKEAKEAYEKANFEYELAKKAAEEQLAAGLKDAKDAEEAAEAAKKKADEYYQAQLEAKRASEAALYDATAALLEASEKLDASLAKLDKVSKEVLDEFGDAAPAYAALVAAKTVTGLAQLTVKGYEAEISTLEALIEKLEPALKDAQDKYDELKAQYDAKEAETETLKVAVEETEAALELAKNIKENAEEILKLKREAHYRESLRLQEKIDAETASEEDIKKLTENVVDRAGGVYTLLDVENGFGKAVNWVEEKDGIILDGQRVFYVEGENGEKIYYEAVIEPASSENPEGHKVVQFYKAELKSKPVGTVEDLPKLGSKPNVGATNYAAVIDGEEVAIVIRKNNSGCGETYEYALVNGNDIGDAEVVDTTKKVFVRADKPEATNSDTVTEIFNLAGDQDKLDKEIEALIQMSANERMALDKATRELLNIEAKLDRAAETVEFYEKVLEGANEQKTDAEYDLNGKFPLLVDGILKQLEKEDLNVTECSGILAEVLGDLMLELGASGADREDISNLTALITKMTKGEFELSDVETVLSLLGSENLHVSAKLRLAIAKLVQRFVEINYEKEAAELKQKADEFEEALKEVGNASSEYAKAVYKLSIAAVTDARNAVLKAEAKVLKLKADEARRAANQARIEYEALKEQYGPTNKFVEAAKTSMEEAEANAEEANKKYEVAQRIADVCFSSDLHLSPVSTDDIFFDGKKDGLRYDIIVKLFEDQKAEADRLGITLENSVLFDAFVVEDGERVDEPVTLDKKVTMELDVPEELLNKPFKNANKRTYTITCYHDGEVIKVAENLSAVNGRVSFKADKFSTYEIKAVDTYVKAAVNTATR